MANCVPDCAAIMRMDPDLLGKTVLARYLRRLSVETLLSVVHVDTKLVTGRIFGHRLSR